MLIALLLLGFFVSSYSFQKARAEREKRRAIVTARPEIRTLNSGQPFHSEGVRYAPGQVLVKFKPEVRTQLIDATMAAYGSKKIREIPRLTVYQVQIPEALSVEEMVFALKQNPDIEYAEPNYVARIMTTPNDTLFKYQYALHNTGQEIGGLPGSPRGKSQADIHATAGWEEAKGKEDTIIAIVDSGVDLEHPDIKNKIVSGGRDFANDDWDATDDNGHGTFVAGIAAADTNNDEGMAGTAWNCRVLPVKVTDEDGVGLYSWIVDGIIWAADNGANVINISLGGDEEADSLREALQYAHDKGVVIAAAAGNSGDSVVYPAAYDDFCLAVAATDYNDERMSWSSHGSQVDVAAPGERILSIVPTWYWPSQGDVEAMPYAFGSGTSGATPHVSGLAAILKGLKPGLGADDIMSVIRYSSDDVNKSEFSGKDEFIGYGRINLEKALVPIKISK
jgi:subtilisin family serine protease